MAVSRPAHAVPPGTYAAVAIGALAGGYLRVGLSLTPWAGSSDSWPWVTFAVNVSGTLALAFAVAFLSLRANRARLVRPLVVTGFGGTLTTFSTLQLEVFRMLDAGNVALAAGYLAASIVAGGAAFLLGGTLARRIYPE